LLEALDRYRPMTVMIKFGKNHRSFHKNYLLRNNYYDLAPLFSWDVGTENEEKKYNRFLKHG